MGQNSFKEENYAWSVNGLNACISENHLKSEIIYATKTAAIVHVKSYNDSVILGAESCWCISQHDCSWKQYVTDKKAVQLFIYDFSKKSSNPLSLIGTTFILNDKRPNAYCAFTKENIPLNEHFKGESFENDEEALFYMIWEIFDGTVEELIIDEVNDRLKVYIEKEKIKNRKENFFAYVPSSNHIELKFGDYWTYFDD